MRKVLVRNMSNNNRIKLANIISKFPDEVIDVLYEAISSFIEKMRRLSLIPIRVSICRAVSRAHHGDMAQLPGKGAFPTNMSAYVLGQNVKAVPWPEL